MGNEHDTRANGAAWGWRSVDGAKYGNEIVEMIVRGNLVRKEGPTCLRFMPNAQEQLHAYVIAQLMARAEIKTTIGCLEGPTGSGGSCCGCLTGHLEGNLWIFRCNECGKEWGRGLA